MRILALMYSILALVTGFLIDQAGWRSAFVWPGAVCVAIGLTYAVFLSVSRRLDDVAAYSGKPNFEQRLQVPRNVLVKIFAVIFFSTAVGGLVFQSTTFSLPKVFDERLGDLALTATSVGGFAFLVFALASVGQLIVGFLLDRVSLKTVFLAVVGIQALFFALGDLYLCVTPASGPYPTRDSLLKFSVSAHPLCAPEK